MTSIKVREARVRRQLANHHMRLVKAPSRHWTREYYAVGYMIVDHRNTVVEGAISESTNPTWRTWRRLLPR